MTRGALLLAAAAWGASLTVAMAQGTEAVRVRSGDHPGFSRLVVELDRPAEWQFGRVEGGYALEVAGGTDFDLSRVFDLIGRTRIADVSKTASDGGRMTIALACDCHAQVSRYRGNWIVIDIADGPPPAGSPFEAALAAPTSPAGPALPGSARRAPPSRARIAAIADTPVSIAAEPTVAPHPIIAAANQHPASGEAAWSVRTSPRAVWLGDHDAEAWAARFGRHATPAATRVAQRRDGGGPEARLGEEERLVRDLARAASQGLLETSLPDLNRARDALRSDATPPPTDAAPDPEVQDGGPPGLDSPQVRIDARTSVDRDLGFGGADAGATSDGTACLDDEVVDIGAWGGPEEPANGIAKRRAALVGDSERPDPAAAHELARYYLHLGFGAEARAVLLAHPGSGSAQAALLAIAAVLEDTVDRCCIRWRATHARDLHVRARELPGRHSDGEHAGRGIQPGRRGARRGRDDGPRARRRWSGARR